MSLLGGGSKSSIPSMSWDSVLDDGPAGLGSTTVRADGDEETADDEDQVADDVDQAVADVDQVVDAEEGTSTAADDRDSHAPEAAPAVSAPAFAPTPFLSSASPAIEQSPVEAAASWAPTEVDNAGQVSVPDAQPDAGPDDAASPPVAVTAVAETDGAAATEVAERGGEVSTDTTSETASSESASGEPTDADAPRPAAFNFVAESEPFTPSGPLRLGRGRRRRKDRQQESEASDDASDAPSATEQDAASTPEPAPEDTAASAEVPTAAAPAAAQPTVPGGTEPSTVLAADVPVMPGTVVDTPPPAAPMVPSPAVVPTGLSLPQAPAVPSAAPPRSNAPGHATFTPIVPPSARKPKRSGGGAFGLLLTLIIVGGLVAAGVIYGRPYLFPEEWDPSSADYAENIEALRGVSYTEPLIVVAEPTEEYRRRVGDQLLGDWEEQMPMWRALGLAAGGTEREVLDTLIAERSSALYDEADGQVYHDASLPSIDVDAHVTLAMAEAAIDQEFLLTQGAARRGLLAEALTDAHVLQQSTAIQQMSDAPTEIRPTNDSTLAFLPPVLDYELVAPLVFAELLGPWDEVAPNALATTDAAGGPGPIEERPVALGPAPVLPEGQTAVGEPRQLDRGEWFMVFASHLEPQLAWTLVNDLSAAALTETSLAGTTCFVSTFDSLGGAPLGDSLTVWAASAAPELQASASVLETGAVQLSTCDPGEVFTSAARFGLARNLIAFEATELAIAVEGRAAGMTDAQIDQAIVASRTSGLAAPVLLLEPTATAREVAGAARSTVAAVVGPVAVAETGAADGDAVDAGVVDAPLPVEPTGDPAPVEPAPADG